MDNVRTVQARFDITKKNGFILFDAHVTIWKSPKEFQTAQFVAQTDLNKNLISSTCTAKSEILHEVLKAEVENFFAQLENDEVHEFYLCDKYIEHCSRVEPLNEWKEGRTLKYGFEENYEL